MYDLEVAPNAVVSAVSMVSGKSTLVSVSEKSRAVPPVSARLKYVLFP